MTTSGPTSIEEIYAERERPPLLQAIAAAFAVVASADGRVELTEVQRFWGVVDSTDDLKTLDRETIQSTFDEFVTAFVKNAKRAKQEALETIATIKENEQDRQIVISAAQIAIVADGRIVDSEESAIADICGALGVDPKDY